MGRDCASERVPIALAEGRPEDSQARHQRRLTSPPLPSRGGPAKLWFARALHPGQPENDVAIGLARSAHRAEPVHPDLLQPDVAFAPLVGLGLVAHAAERERPGYRLERLDGDGDPDHGRAALNGTMLLASEPVT